MSENKFNEPWTSMGMSIVQADGDHIAKFHEDLVMAAPRQNERACECVNAFEGLRPEKLAGFIEAVIAIAKEDCNLDCESEICRDTLKCIIRDFRQALAELRDTEEEGDEQM